MSMSLCVLLLGILGIPESDECWGCDYIYICDCELLIFVFGTVWMGSVFLIFGYPIVLKKRSRYLENEVVFQMI